MLTQFFRKTAPYKKGRKLLDIIDMSILDFLIGNMNRAKYYTLTVIFILIAARTVVYFDQKTGDLHAICLLKSSFLGFLHFLNHKLKK